MSANIKAILRKAKCGLWVAQAVSNWPHVGRYLLRSQNKDRGVKVDLHFRNSNRFLNMDYMTAWSFIEYYHYAHLFGVFSESDLLVLDTISSDITNKLNSVFTKEEIRHSSSGGWIECGRAGGWIGTKCPLLFILIRRFKPSTVIETGVAQGVSSYFILKALELNGSGRLISIDLPQRDPEGYTYSDGTVDFVYTPSHLDSGWLVPDELKKLWTLKLGRSSEILPTMDIQVDMFFHDSEHSYQNMKFEFEWACKHINTNGTIMSDDIAWNRAWPELISSHKNLQEYAKGELVGVARARTP